MNECLSMVLFSLTNCVFFVVFCCWLLLLFFCCFFVCFFGGVVCLFFNPLCVWVSFIQNELLWKQCCLSGSLNMTPGWSVALTRLTAELVLSASAPCLAPHIPEVSARSLNLTLHSIQTITVVIRHHELCHLSCKYKSTSIMMKMHVTRVPCQS